MEIHSHSNNYFGCSSAILCGTPKSTIYAQKFLEDSSTLGSQDSLLSNLSDLSDFANSGSTSPLSDLPFDLQELGNLFTGKSILGTIGVSMVDNVSISGVQLISGSTISVTLKHDIINNQAPPVTVIAYKISLNNTDIGTLIESISKNDSNLQSNSNSYFSNSLTAQSDSQPSLFNNPLTILKKIQIGSSSIINQGWISPKTLSMGMMNIANYPSNFNLILIVAIPYTGID